MSSKLKCYQNWNVTKLKKVTKIKIKIPEIGTDYLGLVLGCLWVDIVQSKELQAELPALSPFTPPVSPQITDGETFFKLKYLEVAKEVIKAKNKEIEGVLVTLQVRSVELPISYSVCC